ncbi:MAG: DNA translocase FtsK 4TM domain-containing protein [Deltaproteobacteria bacterium]|nr:DNA translocase FtsK 4TM domain-containing protein [Deltaproteobacteria bacterium]
MEKGSRLNREIWGVLILVFALVISLSLFSYDPSDKSFNTPSGMINPTHNWGGVLGSYTADILLQLIGVSAFLVPLFFCVISYYLFRDRYRGLHLVRALGSASLGFILFITSSAVLFNMMVESNEVVKKGGMVGDFSGQKLTFFIGPIATYAVGISVLLLTLMFTFRISLVSCWEWVRPRAGKFRKRTATLMRSGLKQLSEWNEKRKAENTKKEHREYLAPPIILSEEVKEAKGTNESKQSPPTKTKKITPPLQQEFPLPEIDQGYKLPSISLLDSPASQHVEIDNETLNAIGLTLQRKLADLGVEGQVKSVHPGPVITMFKFEPAAGVKVRRIVTLADDLAMALRAVSVRILAPIPGESVVGIEIPNPRREKVFLKQVIGGDGYQSTDSKLTLALGKDISGAPFLADLARMPHLLVAGATGTGKSVSLNAMILSILFKATPQDVKFIMIDPKMLELTVYEELPHMLVPVVTDPKKAAAALFWAMDEMDRRYRLMREKRARNIDHYNKILQRQIPDKAVLIDLKDPEEVEEANEITGDAEDQSPLVHEHLPRIVIVVDELADLMMSVRRDIEEHITRLAQKARAAGIHMILATQRPSVDIITGLIKANFPARISFQVTSRVDSRTILDSIGAERLLGDGDMLYLPPGTARLTRIQGAYVSYQEVRKAVDFLKRQAKPRYRPEVFQAKKEVEAANGDDEYDEMYDEAVKLVTETEQASISMIQRRLRVGYNRAARMIEQMERDGVVGPADGARPREVIARKIDD